MKKTLAATLAFILLFTLLFCSTPVSGILAFAEEIVNPEFVIDENGVLTKYNGPGGHVTVPDGVTRIGDGAFYREEKNITQVTLPESVEVIGRDVFAGSTNLAAVQMPGVKEIDIGAFASCTNLVSVQLPKVEVIGSSAFTACRGLQTVAFSPNLTRIESGAFANCWSLTNFTFPENLSYIGSNAFFYISGPASITIPSSVKEMESCAFQGLENLKSVTVNSGAHVGTSAFMLNKNLSTVTIKNGAFIEVGAFEYLENLTNVVIEDNVVLGAYAFSHSSKSLREMQVRIGKNVTIGGNAFQYNGVKTVQIGEGAKIENCAFQLCSQLESVTIEGGEDDTHIGAVAFISCDNLKEVTLSEGVAEIGDGAFAECRSLPHIEIPASVQTIGAGAFRECTGLASFRVDSGNKNYSSLNDVLFNKDKTELITYPAGRKASLYEVPASVTRFRERAFNYSQHLETLWLPEGLTDVGGAEQFGQCTALKNIRVSEGNLCYSSSSGVLFNADKTKLIKYPVGRPSTSYTVPSGVTTIGSCSFNNNVYYYDDVDSPNLKSVTLPSSVTQIEGYAFAKDIQLYFPNGSYAEQYAQQTGMGYQVTSRFADEFYVYVMDSATQKPIFDATVQLKDETTGMVMYTAQTDASGMAGFPKTAVYMNAVVSAPDYRVAERLVNTRNQVSQSVFLLDRDTEPGVPYLISATVTTAYGEFDVLKQVYSANSSASEPSASIRLKADWRGRTPVEYRLTDGVNQISNSTGVFRNIEIGKTFEPGKKIYARLTYKDLDGNTQVKQILTNIEVYDGASIILGSGENQIKYGKDISHRIPNTAGYLSDIQVSTQMDFLPFQIDKTGDKIKIAIGLADENGMGPKSIMANFDDYKKKVDEVLAKSYNVYQARKCLDQYINWEKIVKPKFKFLENLDIDLDVFGYIELKQDKDKFTIVDSGIFIDMGASVEYVQQFVVSGAPMYFEIIGAIKAQIRDHIQCLTGGAIMPDDLNFSFKLTLGVGFGINNVLRGGARGSAEIEMMNDYINEHYRGTLTGTLSLYGQFLIFEGEIPIFSGTCVIYDNYANGANTLRSSSVMPKMALSLYDSSEYSISSRDYGDKPGQWLGGGARLRSLALRSGTPDVSRQETLLQTSVYSGAEPMIGEYGGKRFLLWTADSASRGAADRTMLSYSVYNPLTGGWSAPQALQDDGTADSFPQFAGGDDLFVVWQDNNTRFGDTAELNAWAASSEIKVAKAAGADSLGSAEITTLTSNASADFMPKIAAEGNEAAIVWLGNSENDMLGVSGANSVFLSTYNGSEWSAPQQIFETQNPVMNLDVGFVNGDVSVVLDVDTDGDAYTLEDREIFLKKGSAGFERLTNNETLDSGAQFAEIGGETALFWYADGNIAYRTFSENGGLHTVFAEQKADLSDTFEIITNGENTALTWSKEMDETAEVFASMYDSETGEWSRETAVTAAGASLRNTHGVFDDSGNLMIAANRKTPQESGGFQNDLVVYFVPPKPDAEAIDYYYEQADVQAGAQLPVTVGVGNEGQQPIEEVTVTIADPSGEILVADTKECSILPGETADVTCLLPLPEAICLTEYTVTVTTPGDGNARNDFLTMKVGYTDLCLSVEEYDTETARYADLMITNLTDVPTGATLTIRENSKDGPVVYEQEFETIDKSTNGSYLFRIDKTTLEYEADGTKTYYYSVSSTVEEYSGADNTALTVVSSDDAYELQKNLPVTGVVLSAAALQMVPTDTAKINAAVLPYNAADKTLTWSSSNESVAVVDENGLVTAKAAGTASITAAAGEKSASCLITVSEGEPHSITLSTEGRGTALCPEEALPGSKVSIELRPEEGARLNRQAILCTGISAEDITAGGSTLTFTMPNHAVSLTLPFEEYEYAVFRDGTWKNGGLTAGSTAQIADGRLCGDGISLETGSVPENLGYLVLRAKAQPLEKPEISLGGRTCAIASLEQYGRTLEGFDKTLVLDTGGFTGGTLFLNAAGLEIEELYFASEKPEIPYAEGELAGVTISEEEAYQNLPVTFQVLSPVAYNRIKAVDDEGNLLKYEDGYTLLENGMYLYEFSIPFAEAGEKTIRFHGRLTQDSMYFSDIGETVYLNVLPHAGIRRVEQVGTDYDGKILIEVETQAGLFNRVKLTDENNVLLGHTGLFTPGESDTDIWTIAIDAPAGTKITAQGRYGSYYTRETKSIVLHAPDPIPQSDLLSVEQGSIDESGQVTITVITTAGVYNRVKLLSESGELLGHTGISSPGREEGTEVWVITISAQAGDTVVAKGRIDSTYTREALSYTIV